MPESPIETHTYAVGGVSQQIIFGTQVIAVETQREIHSIAEGIDSLPVDEKTKSNFHRQLQEYERVFKEAAEGVLARQEIEFQLKIDRQTNDFQQQLKEKELELRLREQETKTQRIIRLMDKDIVAVVIGGILLIIFGIALLAMMLYGKVDTQLVESVFFILLGYFFGQGVAGRIGQGDRSQDRKTDNPSSGQ